MYSFHFSHLFLFLPLSSLLPLSLPLSTRRPCNWVKDSSFTRAPLQDNGRGFRLGHVWGISEYKDKMGTTARMSKEKAKY
mmetsp:Transcript_4022/g.7778  ORF Transcript_4022/g.7778 Transcript_4022/m.7778 type:complete len:80 (+) Transcript_4022:2147-2386(+)